MRFTIFLTLNNAIFLHLFMKSNSHLLQNETFFKKTKQRCHPCSNWMLNIKDFFNTCVLKHVLKIEPPIYLYFVLGNKYYVLKLFNLFLLRTTCLVKKQINVSAFLYYFFRTHRNLKNILPRI